MGIAVCTESLPDIGELLESYPGFIVLDTSALLTLLHADDIKMASDYHEKQEGIETNIEASIELRNAMAENKRIVFPGEVKSEFEQFTKYHLESEKRRLTRLIHSIEKRGNPQWAQELATIFVKAREGLYESLTEREGIVKEMRLLEDRLSQRNRDKIPIVQHTVFAVSEDFYRKRPRMRALRYSSGSRKNKQNDEKILAKSFILSYHGPVTVISRDDDFREIYSLMNSGLDTMQSRVGRLPKYSWSLAYYQDSGAPNLAARLELVGEARAV